MQLLLGLNLVPRFSRKANVAVPALAAMFLMVGLARLACAGTPDQANRFVLERENRTIVIEPFGANIVRVTLSSEKSCGADNAWLWNRGHAFDGRLDSRAGLRGVRRHSLDTVGDPNRTEKSIVTETNAPRRVESVPEEPLLLWRLEPWEVQRLDLHFEDRGRAAFEDVAMVYASK